MSETSPQSRNAALAIAVITFGGILAGLIIPNVLTEHHVEYGAWPEGSDGSARRCVVGTVWIGDDVRPVGSLPLISDGAPPYCVYRACFDPGDTALAAFGTAGTPLGMDPLFAEVEEPWQAPWPPLSVWCGGDEPDEPPGCACRLTNDTVGACEMAITDLDGVETWSPASPNVTLQRARWRGACWRAPCVVLAGRDFFPPECCVPRCEGRACGADGCGGSCGACTDPDVCGGQGTCEPPPPPPAPEPPLDPVPPPGGPP